MENKSINKSSSPILLLSNSTKIKKMYDMLAEIESNIVIYGGEFSLEFVESLKPIFVISHGYSKIIKDKNAIEYMSGRIINLHPSLLPFNRGSYSNFWGLITGSRMGVTVHQLDMGIDTGDILLQKELYFDIENETFRTTYMKTEEAMLQLFYKNWFRLKNEEFCPRKQQGEGSYYSIKQFNDLNKDIPVDWDERIKDYIVKLKKLNREEVS